MTVPARFPRFFVTNPAPCPYLPGKTERKVFTELNGSNADALNESLGRIGFRRSQNVAYRPSCEHCKACVSVRVSTMDFKPNNSQKRAIRNNQDLIVTACKSWSTEEQFGLLRQYLNSRHPDGGMSEMDEIDFADMIEQTPVRTNVIEYRLPTGSEDEDGNDISGKLIGACLTDQQSDGLSMIYSFYDAANQDRSGLGNFIILDHILRARAAGLPYVYLGYWVAESPRMKYKTRYKPLEKLGPNGWETLNVD